MLLCLLLWGFNDKTSRQIGFSKKISAAEKGGKSPFFTNLGVHFPSSPLFENEKVKAYGPVWLKNTNPASSLFIDSACVYSFFLREMAVKAKVEKPKTNFYVVNIELYPRPLETLRG